MLIEKNITLGETREGKTIYINPKTRSTHMHIIGSSGEGKSKFIEHLIRQDIINNNGLCLIDPHGYLYDDIVRWCETKRMLDPDRVIPKKIILFDPSAEGWTFGFNPILTDTPDISFHVDAMVKAVAKVWGGEDPDKTPLLKRCLRILFHALAEKKLTLYEAQYLINPTNPLIRKYLTQDLHDLIIREQWNYFNQLKPQQYCEQFGSSVNRMMEFLASSLIRTVVGQSERTINFRKIMDEGWVLLVNLSSGNKISDDNARLLGALIVNELFMKAKARPDKSRPFYLYIDECALFVNEDIRRILDEGRKFGIHLILAHQHLAQLKKAGEDVYHAVMTDAKTKVVFGGLNLEDARVLAEQVFLGEHNLEEAKESLSKPVVVGYIKTWLENYSRGRSTTRGTSHSSSSGENSGDGSSESSTVKPKGFWEDDEVSSTSGNSRSNSRNWSESEGDSFSEGESESWGRSETFLPVLEERPNSVFSLEEQIYRSMVLMVNQPQQHAIIKLPKQRTRIVKTPFIKDGYARDERVMQFKEKCYNLAEFANPKDLIEAQIEQRQAQLLEQALEAENCSEEDNKKADPKTFRG